MRVDNRWWFVLLLPLVGLFSACDFGPYLDLATIKSRQANLQAWRAGQAILAGVLFITACASAPTVWWCWVAGRLATTCRPTSRTSTPPTRWPGPASSPTPPCSSWCVAISALFDPFKKFGADYRVIADGEVPGFVKVPTVPGKDESIGTIHTYPTLAEANKRAAGHGKRARASQRLLARVERFHARRHG